MLRNLFNEVIDAPLNSWVRVCFDRFPTREFGTGTICVGDVDNSMFMDTLSLNMKCNDASEIDNGWECNLVISYILHGSRHPWGGFHERLREKCGFWSCWKIFVEVGSLNVLWIIRCAFSWRVVQLVLLLFKCFDFHELSWKWTVI